MDNKTQSCITKTPWGHPISVRNFAKGIDFVTADNSGGFMINAEFFRKMSLISTELESTLHTIKKKFNAYWFEEDMQYCIVVCCFPRYFDKSTVALAEADMKKYYPQAWESLLKFRETGTDTLSLNELSKYTDSDEFHVVDFQRFKYNPVMLLCSSIQGGLDTLAALRRDGKKPLYKKYILSSDDLLKRKADNDGQGKKVLIKPTDLAVEKKDIVELTDTWGTLAKLAKSQNYLVIDKVLAGKSSADKVCLRCKTNGITNAEFFVSRDSWDSRNLKHLYSIDADSGKLSDMNVQFESQLRIINGGL